jgi:chromosome segregation ATPase
MARGGGSGTLSSDRLQASIMRLEERATMLQEEGLRAALDRSRAELEAERVENKALQAALAELSGRATIQERELDDKLALENALHDLSSQLTMQQSELSELREERELATGARDSMQAILRETVESCEEREAGSEAAMQYALRSMTSLEEEAIRIRAERDELQLLQTELIQGQMQADRLQEDVIGALQAQLAQLDHAAEAGGAAEG